MSHFHLLWTIALMFTFIGIFAWAWSKERKTDFAEAAQLALDGDDMGTELNNAELNSKEKHNV